MPLLLIIASVLLVVIVFWDKIKKLLPALLLILAIALGTGLLAEFIIPTGWSGGILGKLTLTGMSGAFLAAGTSFLLFPDETAEVISDTAESVGEAASAVLAAGANAVGSGITAFLSSPGGLIALGFGAWYFFFRKKDGESVADAERGTEPSSPPDKPVKATKPALALVDSSSDKQVDTERDVGGIAA